MIISRFFCIVTFMNQSVLNLIVLGPQGSGKGTQAELLRQKLNLQYLGAGDALREIANEDTPLGSEVRQRLERGFLVEPELISQVFAESLAKIPPEQGVIIEGYPRTIRQYELMREFWAKLNRGEWQVLFIDLPEEEALRRLANRLICESCGAVYIAGTAGKCKKCGGSLITRHDDHPEAVRQRLNLFKSETLPVIKHMEQEGKVIRIDGRPSIDEVHAAIMDKLV